jgi:transposase
MANLSFSRSRSRNGVDLPHWAHIGHAACLVRLYIGSELHKHWFYQRIIAAYGHPDRRRGKTLMSAIIDTLRRGVPAVLDELAQLGRTLHRRRADILAFFDHHASNGPTEAINGRLEALRRNALGFRNLTHYRWRSLLHSGALHALVNAH